MPPKPRWTGPTDRWGEPPATDARPPVTRITIQNSLGGRGHAPAGMRAMRTVARTSALTRPMVVQFGKYDSVMLSPATARILVPAHSRWTGESTFTSLRRFSCGGRYGSLSPVAPAALLVTGRPLRSSSRPRPGPSPGGSPGRRAAPCRGGRGR